MFCICSPVFLKIGKQALADRSSDTSNSSARLTFYFHVVKLTVRMQCMITSTEAEFSDIVTKKA
jgi:hypothetical protein